MSKGIVGAVGTILSALIVTMALGSVDIPDPEREALNAIPNTSPELQQAGNSMLDVRDGVEVVKTAKNTATAIGVLIAGLASAGLGIGWLSRR